jgi:hypothetical protein
MPNQLTALAKKHPDLVLPSTRQTLSTNDPLVPEADVKTFLDDVRTARAKSVKDGREALEAFGLYGCFPPLVILAFGAAFAWAMMGFRPR